MRDAIFIILGATIAFGFQFILEYWKTIKYEKQQLQNERKKVYQEIVMLITKLEFKEQVDEKILQGLIILVRLYASKNICSKFMSLYHSVFVNHEIYNFGNIINEMRHEIGIQENIE